VVRGTYKMVFLLLGSVMGSVLRQKDGRERLVMGQR